jgi:hypothetical protein
VDVPRPEEPLARGLAGGRGELADNDGQGAAGVPGSESDTGRSMLATASEGVTSF